MYLASLLRRSSLPPLAGVRSHQAKKVLQSMRLGDRALFYHSNAKPPGVVGIVEVRGDRRWRTGLCTRSSMPPGGPPLPAQHPATRATTP